MILLDGAYAVVGIALSLLLLRATTLAAHAPSSRFPYGLRAATPLAVGAQGFALLATLLYAADVDATHLALRERYRRDRSAGRGDEQRNDRK
jgi:predicted Co/Zn/Cd cation transporter (cation efflux family)